MLSLFSYFNKKRTVPLLRAIWTTMATTKPSENCCCRCSKQMERFKAECKSIKKFICTGYNPLKWTVLTLQFTLNVIFGTVFDIICGFLDALTFPFGDWGSDKVSGANSIRVWMNSNKISLSQDAINKLAKHGFKTTYAKRK